MKKPQLLYPALLVLLWILLSLPVNPAGNFPLNDDWQYARPVQFLVCKGYYFSPDQYSPIILAQVLWGALFCLPFGFSFNALRVSVLVLGLFGVLFFYFFTYRFTKNKVLSFLAAMLLLVNPIYFFQSYSFMTDVPFAVVAIVSVYYYFLALENNSRKYIVLGTLFAIVATLIRQFGVIIPLAYAIVAIAKHKLTIRNAIAYSIPALITTVVLKSALLWLKHIGSELKPYQGHHVVDYLKHPATIALQFFERTAFMLFYAGLFLFPVLVLVFNKYWKPLSATQKRAALLFTALFIPFLVMGWTKLPCGPIMSDTGIGILTLKLPLGYNHVQYPIMLNVIIGVAFIGALLLLLCIGAMLATILKQYRTSSVGTSSLHKLFLMACIAGYALLLFIPDFFFDRYLLLFIPMFLLLLITGIDWTLRLKPAFTGFAFFFCALTYIYSFTGTHDYLAWNRARWQALAYLKNDLKISPHKIDGGYEFNGWYVGTYYPLQANKSWWFVDDDEYVISFTRLDGYSIVKQYPYQNYFPFCQRNICILKRD